MAGAGGDELQRVILGLFCFVLVGCTVQSSGSGDSDAQSEDSETVEDTETGENAETETADGEDTVDASDEDKSGRDTASDTGAAISSDEETQSSGETDGFQNSLPTDTEEINSGASTDDDDTEDSDAHSPDEGDSGSDTEANNDGTESETDSDTDSATDSVDRALNGYIDGPHWHGCFWTRTDSLDIGTTVSPGDFGYHEIGDPYCMDGVVGASDDASAAMGFNIFEPLENANCSQRAQQDAPVLPGVVPEEDSIEFYLTIHPPIPATVSLELLAPDDGGAPAKRWCHAITPNPEKKIERFLVQYADFSSACDTAENGMAYNGEPISAVAVRVHGDGEDSVDYSLCVHSISDGSAVFSIDEIPWSGDHSGELGGEGDESNHLARALVTVDGEQYIIRNAYWGGTSGYQILGFNGNSFVIERFTGVAPDGFSVVSYPSIYIGGHGDPALTTAATDNLPIRISDIPSAPMVFKWSDDGDLADSAVVTEMWFATAPPADRYDGAISGAVSLWLWQPGGRIPVGTPVVDSDGDAVNVSFCGHLWTA